MKQRVIETIKEKIGRDFVLEKPKDPKLGDYSTPVAFSLAKEYRKSPMVIAEDLAKEFEDSDIFEEVTAVKGFLNFKLSEKFLDSLVQEAFKDEAKYASSTNSQKILLEYVSANPTGPLHIGHARGAVIGDALCRIGRHLGYKIDSEYYVNDAGNQIRLLGLSIFLA